MLGQSGCLRLLLFNILLLSFQLEGHLGHRALQLLLLLDKLLLLVRRALLQFRVLVQQTLDALLQGLQLRLCCLEKQRLLLLFLL